MVEFAHVFAAFGLGLGAFPLGLAVVYMLKGETLDDLTKETLQIFAAMSWFACLAACAMYLIALF